MMAIVGMITNLGEAASGARVGCTPRFFVGCRCCRWYRRRCCEGISRRCGCYSCCCGGAAEGASAGAGAGAAERRSSCFCCGGIRSARARSVRDQISKSTKRDCRCGGGGLGFTKQYLIAWFDCLTRDSRSRDRRHVRPTTTVVGRACRRALALLHAGLHALLHSRTRVLGLRRNHRLRRLLFCSRRASTHPPQCRGGGHWFR